jgi:hypothetical protein
VAIVACRHQLVAVTVGQRCDGLGMAFQRRVQLGQRLLVSEKPFYESVVFTLKFGGFLMIFFEKVEKSKICKKVKKMNFYNFLQIFCD